MARYLRRINDAPQGSTENGVDEVLVNDARSTKCAEQTHDVARAVGDDCSEHEDVVDRQVASARVRRKSLSIWSMSLTRRL